MARKPKKTNWKDFLKDLNPDIAHLKNYDSWKEDFLAQYGFVWCRWYQDVPKQKIIEDLTGVVAENERRNRNGTISVRLVDNKKIRLTFRSTKKEKAWQKIIYSRLSDKANTLVSKDLNISLDIILTEEEKGLLENECSVTKRVSSLYD